MYSKYFNYPDEIDSFPLFGDDGYRKVGTVASSSYDGNPTRFDLMSCSVGNNYKYYALTKFGERAIVVYKSKKRQSNKLLDGDSVNVGGDIRPFRIILSK